MGDTYRVVGPPPLIFVLGLALGIVADGALTGSDLPVGFAVAGAVLALAGLALQADFLRMFRRAGTAVLPGRAAGALVTDGVYRFTRNPGYVGMAATAAGIALIADAPWALLGVALAITVVDRGVIAREERYLQERFGESYTRYRADVRRWV